MIMDMAVEFTKWEENVVEVIQAINHIKIYKTMFLTCELLRLNRKTPMKDYEQIHEESSFM